MMIFQNVADLINGIKNSNYPAIRTKYLHNKREREKKAWHLIQENRGSITLPKFEEIIDIIDKTSVGNRWYGQTFIGKNRKSLLGTPEEKLNKWLDALLFSEKEVSEAIDEADNINISGAGKSITSILLYVSNPEEYNIMNNATIDGLKRIGFLDELKGRRSKRYKIFNAASNKFRKDFEIDPYETDWFLSHIADRVTSENNKYYYDNEGNSKKMLDKQKFAKAVSDYKKLIHSPEYEELYKWRSFKIFQDNWDINASDFKDMLEKSFQPPNNNLWAGTHFLPRNIIIELAEIYPEEVREMFKNLYDEDDDLNNRMKDFTDKSKELMTRKYDDEDLNTYQNERSIAIYLSLRYPEKYFLYKFGMYRDFMVFFNLPKPKAGASNNLKDFIKLCNEVKNELEKDNELIRMHHDRLTPDCFPDEDNTILTQDFIYCTISSATSKEGESSAPDGRRVKDLNIILYGPPGTGKTYNTVSLALDIIGKNKETHAERIKEFKNNLHDQIEFITFHQNFSYEDFVQGLKPETSGTDQLSFKLHNGIFYEICKRARNNYFKSQLRSGDIKPSFEEVFQELIEPLMEEEVEEIEIPMKTEGYSFFITEVSENTIAFKRKEGEQDIR